MDWFLRYTDYFDDRFGALGALIVPMFAACLLGALIWAHFDAKAQVPRGIVVDLVHHPAYTTMMYVTTGKVTSMIPQHHPERWGIVVKGLRRDGNRGQYEWEVSESTMRSYEIGDEYPRTEETE